MSIISENTHDDTITQSVSVIHPFLHEHKDRRTNDKNEYLLIQQSLAEIEFPKLLSYIAKFSMTSLGKEIIERHSPIINTEWLQSEHNYIQEMLSILQRGEQFPLEHTANITSHLHRSSITGAYLMAVELYDVVEVLQSARRVRNYVTTISERLPHLRQLTDAIYENRFLEKHITSSIDETGTVRDTASATLEKIRQDIGSTTARLRSRLNKLVEKLGDDDVLREEYITQRDGRFVIPIKVENKRVIPGIIHGISGSGSTVFLEPADVFEMNNELSLLHAAEQREIIAILTTLTAEIGGVANEIMSTLTILAHIDTLYAKAQYAYKLHGYKPRIVDDSTIELTNIYHPLLLQTKGREAVVPLSVSFTKNGSSPVFGHLISGPNAGGKSVAMKSIGLNVALALSGIFPLGECCISPCRIFTAIGDHQSIESDLSTFSSQVKRLRDILSYCGNDSLVLIDEICSGTDPTEGSALAAGIIDSLVECKAYFIVTTHQSSLKSYALTKSTIQNASLEFDSLKLEPTYKFLQGVPGNSYAFEVARTIGLPELVLKRATSHLGEKHAELEQSISIIQQYRVEAIALEQEARIKLREAQKSKDEYEKRFAEFKDKYKLLMQAAKNEAKVLVDNARKSIEEAIRDIRQQTKPIADVKADIEKLRSELIANLPVIEKNAREALSIGDKVVIIGSEQAGTIVEIDDKSSVVDFNGIRFKVAMTELKKTSELPKLSYSTTNRRELKLDSSISVDVRGMRAHEAINQIDTFINDAILGNSPYVSILHGKGTGVLRKTVHDFLAEHPSVDSFRLGEQGEGDAGVTIVELR